MHRNVDRISNLPDELLCDILSLLPTKCAVETSTLSKRWKCLYMFTNRLSFHAPFVTGKKAANAQRESFKAFVNKVLSSHQVSPIQKFHLDCDIYTYDASRLHTWIGFALSKGVAQLHLFLGHRPLGHRPLNALPDCLFNCQTIVELKIDSTIEDLHVPEAIHLPNLKTLYFRHVGFVDYESLGRFFSACPLLEELVMRYCTCSKDTDRHVRVYLGELKRFTMYLSDGWFEIDSPKLVYLQISYSCIAHVVLSLKNPKRLVTADVNFNNIRVNSEIPLMRAIHYVKELRLGIRIDEFLSYSEDYNLPSYPNLVKLRLDFLSCKAWKYVRHLLGNAPQLETVVFNQGFNKGDKRRDKWPTDVELAPFSSCVKVIEVSKFFGYTRELVFLKYLLANADDLNALILKKWTMTEKQTLEARKKLLKFPRASETCDIQLGEE